MLGDIGSRIAPESHDRRHSPATTVSELSPEVIQPDLDGDGLRVASAAEALDRQGPVRQSDVVQSRACFARAALSLRNGLLSRRFVVVSLATVTGVAVDPRHWHTAPQKAAGREIQSATLPYWQNLASSGSGLILLSETEIEPFSLISCIM